MTLLDSESTTHTAVIISSNPCPFQNLTGELLHDELVTCEHVSFILNNAFNVVGFSTNLYQGQTYLQVDYIDYATIKHKNICSVTSDTVTKL